MATRLDDAAEIRRARANCRSAYADICIQDLELGVMTRLVASVDSRSRRRAHASMVSVLSDRIPSAVELDGRRRCVAPLRHSLEWLERRP